ncbi:hydrogenase/urease accessory protein HupE [Amorphus suaedae]
MTRLVLALFLTFNALLPSAVSAHALDPGYLNLEALGQDRWRVTWRVPDVGGSPMALAAQLPDGCSGAPLAAAAFDGRAWLTSWIVTCPGGLSGGRIGIDGLDRTGTDALVRYEPEPGKTQVRRLTATETAFVVPADADVLEVLTSYVVLGITHILEGVDHLLFVLCLILLIRTPSGLLWAVTAFTLAHSITLAAAALGLLKIPSPPVEAVIALSIVFLAYELALPPERRDPLTDRFPWIVAFGFGLIHGLGFAGALREIGLPEGDVPLALFAFNAGVELGQLMFIAVVLAAGFAVRAMIPVLTAQGPRCTRVASYAIGSTAAFWVIDRISGF